MAETECGLAAASDDQPVVDVYVIHSSAESRIALFNLSSGAGFRPLPFCSWRDFEAHLDHLKPGIILLEVTAGADTSEFARRLRGRLADWPIVAMSHRCELATALPALRVQATDIVEYPGCDARLLDALAAAQQWMGAQAAAASLARAAAARLDRLTRQERLVFHELLHGARNADVAERLGISLRTVEMHRRHLMAKLGIRSLHQGLAMALIAGARSA